MNQDIHIYDGARLPFFRNEYNTLLTLLTLMLLLAFPAATYAVFGLGADRMFTSKMLSIVYVVVMISLFIIPWLPLPALQGDSRFRRLERMVYIWICAHILTALLWEIPWMLLHEQIAAARDELWAYTWWAYIDGGDLRLANPNWFVFYTDAWAEANGIVGAVAFYVWFRSGKTNVLPVYYFMFFAPIHIYSTLIYYVSEIAEGFPNVDQASAINLYVKFLLANSFWVVMPLFVLIWGKQALEQVYRLRYSQRVT